MVQLIIEQYLQLERNTVFAYLTNLETSLIEESLPAEELQEEERK